MFPTYIYVYICILNDKREQGNAAHLIQCWWRFRALQARSIPTQTWASEQIRNIEQGTLQRYIKRGVYLDGMLCKTCNYETGVDQMLTLLFKNKYIYVYIHCSSRFFSYCDVCVGVAPQPDVQDLDNMVSLSTFSLSTDGIKCTHLSVSVLYPRDIKAY